MQILTLTGEFSGRSRCFTLRERSTFPSCVAPCLSGKSCAYGPSAGAFDSESPKSKSNKKHLGHEIRVFLMEFHHILHARSCNYFLLFPHTPRPPRRLKRPKTLFYVGIFPTFTFLAYFLEPIWAMLTRPVQGPLCLLPVRLAELLSRMGSVLLMLVSIKLTVSSHLYALTISVAVLVASPTRALTNQSLFFPMAPARDA